VEAPELASCAGFKIRPPNLALARNTHLHLSFVDRQRRIEVVIQGPPPTFQREDAVAVANAFVVAE